MNKKLFKFVECKRDDGEGVTQIDTLDGLESSSEMIEPIAPGQYINIVKDFKWTKTSRNSEGRNNTPTVEFEEYYVMEPAFWTNLKTVTEVLIGQAQQGLQTGETLLNQAWELAFGEQAPESVTSVLTGGAGEVGKFKGVLSKKSPFNIDNTSNLDLPTGGPAYLKAYEDTYGVRNTKFKYKLPYLEDNYKSVSNDWGDGTQTLQKIPGAGTGLDFINTLQSVMSPGVGIDYTKSFNYDTTPPSHKIRFFLDNTKDSEYTGSASSGLETFTGVRGTDVTSNYETNWRFIFLLLYQNLPNRVNKSAIHPPVIYRAKLPGVFSYRWCFLNNININMVGVRKSKKINIFETGGPSDVVIPEGYEVELSLQSLLPESQNLYYDSIANPVISSVFGDL